MATKTALINFDPANLTSRASTLINKAVEQTKVQKYRLLRREASAHPDDLPEHLEYKDARAINQVLCSVDAMALARNQVFEKPEQTGLTFRNVLGEMVARFGFKKTGGYEVTGRYGTQFAPRQQQKAKDGKGSGSRKEHRVKPSVEPNDGALHKGAIAVIILDAAKGIVHTWMDLLKPAQ